MGQLASAMPVTETRNTLSPKTAERRTGKRHMTVLRIGKIIADGGESLCMIRNISTGGLMAHVYRPLPPGQQVIVECKGGHSLPGHVAWYEGEMAGIQFDTSIDVLHFLAKEQTDLMAGQVSRSPRLNVGTHVTIRRGAHYVRAELVDISQGGAKVTEGDAFDADDDVVLSIPGMPTRAGTVRWRREGHAGISFNERIPFEMLARWGVDYGCAGK